MSAKYDSSTKAKPGDPSEPTNKRVQKDQTDIADKVSAIQFSTWFIDQSLMQHFIAAPC
jgi:hypothetical protein